VIVWVAVVVVVWVIVVMTYETLLVSWQTSMQFCSWKKSFLRRVVPPLDCLAVDVKLASSSCSSVCHASISPAPLSSSSISSICQSHASISLICTITYKNYCIPSAIFMFSNSFLTKNKNNKLLLANAWGRVLWEASPTSEMTSLQSQTIKYKSMPGSLDLQHLPAIFISTYNF